MFTTYYWGDKSRRRRWVGHAAPEEKGDMCKKFLVKFQKGILPSLSMAAGLSKLRTVSWLEWRLRLVISACRYQNTQRMCSGIIDGSFICFCFSY